MEKIYICSEKTSNKYWKYNLTQLSVYCEWGRIGAPPQGDVTKNFYSMGELNKWLGSKIREKEKKGYKEVTEEKLEKQNSIATKLGFRNKISRMEWVRKINNKLIKTANYDPDELIYVEVLDSYSSNANKKIWKLLLSKSGSWSITGSIAETDDSINYFGDLDTLSSSNKFIQVIREMLMEMSINIVEIIKTAKFGVVGRNIFGSIQFEQTSVQPKQNLLSSIDSTGFSDSVIRKFAVMGGRKLSL